MAATGLINNPHTDQAHFTAEAGACCSLAVSHQRAHCIDGRIVQAPHDTPAM